MSVDIRIRTDTADPDAALQLVLNDDGYYWFLHPLFERLRDECGKYIDLYGGAVFTRDDYPRLRRLLDEADTLAARQRETWQVHVGTQLRPFQKELYRTVERDRLQKLISDFRNMVAAADRLGAELECLGD